MRKKYTYIPKDEIESITTWSGKNIPQDKILDGAYVKKGKYADGGMMNKGGKMYQDFGYHVINKDVKLKNGKKVYVTKGRYYWDNELGDNRPSGIYYTTKEGDFISVNDIKFEDGGMMAKGGVANKRSLMSMANLVVADNLNVKIKDWYTKTYPTDDLGEQLNDDVTFKELWNGLHNNMNVYEIMGVGDSIVRERLFEHLAEITGVDYDYVYNKWLNSDYADGGDIDDDTDTLKIEIEYDEDTDSYEVEYEFDGIEIYGVLEKYYTGRDNQYEFKPSYFEDTRAEEYYDENWEDINDEILSVFHSKFKKGGQVKRNRYGEGGDVGQGNLEMMKNQAIQVKHHADELIEALKQNPRIDAWVVSLMDRATQNLSNITHYLDGELKHFSKGGRLK